MDLANLNINGDSDSDDDSPPLGPNGQPLPSPAILRSELTTAFQSLNLTSDNLHDTEWVRKRNITLIHRLLSLDSPTLTPPMLEFLTAESVPEMLAEFISQPSQEDDSSPQNAHVHSTIHVVDPTLPFEVRLQNSYRAAALISPIGNHITPAQPSALMHSYTSQAFEPLLRTLLKAFHATSNAHMWHVCHVLTFLYKFHGDEFLNTIGRNVNAVKRAVQPMLSCIEHPAVQRLFVQIVTLQDTNATTDKRWKFSCALSDYRLLLQLTTMCVDVETTSERGAALSEVIVEVVETLCEDDHGEIMLSPLGYCEELCEMLINAACDTSNKRSLVSRTGAARVLVEIAVKSKQEQITIAQPNQPAFMQQMEPNVKENKMNAITPLFHKNLQANIATITTFLIHAVENATDDTPRDVKHPGRSTSKQSFTVARLLMFRLLVEIITKRPSRIEELPVALYPILCSWFFAHAENNMYQFHFYAFVFQVLRKNDETALSALFKTSKFITHCVDAFDQGKGNRGMILQIMNATRLQICTLAPSTFLRGFLQSHDGWKAFQGQLREMTMSNLRSGMGKVVPEAESMPGHMQVIGAAVNNKSLLMSGADKDGIDIGSDFACSMGFEDELVFPSEGESPGGGKKKKKKKKRKKKKKKAKEGEEGGEGEEEEEEEEGEEEGED